MKQKAGVKQSRQRYSNEFKEQALRRAEQDGVARVAKDLKLPASQLYAWRAKAQQRSQTSEEQRLEQAENARLKWKKRWPS
jgi:transposase